MVKGEYERWVSVASTGLVLSDVNWILVGKEHAKGMRLEDNGAELI